jgi:hypothetical protein
MPRSNKKKSFLKPPPKHPTNQALLQSSHEISSHLSVERNQMILRATSSGRRHGIDLVHGSSNPGLGDCAFEAIIQNNNDRPCFKENFPLPINSYRQMWVTDMANRTVNTDWNILSHRDWLDGWSQMLVPGTYERGIFGDLMLPGIACGVRKLLLIFNTNSESPHDPIYVVDPRQFNIEPDTVIPIILAYNQSHYESMHPCTNADIKTSIDLVREYLENRYRFSKKDFPFLLGLDNRRHGQSSNEEVGGTSRTIFGKQNIENKNKILNIKEAENTKMLCRFSR